MLNSGIHYLTGVSKWRASAGEGGGPSLRLSYMLARVLACVAKNGLSYSWEAPRPSVMSEWALGAALAPQNWYDHSPCCCSETWPVKKENQLTLQRAEMRMIRWMGGVEVTDKFSCSEMRERLDWLVGWSLMSLFKFNIPFPLGMRFSVNLLTG